MNSRQVKYAIMLAQVRNFSQVAEQLGISQPGLSKHIINLEQDLGVKLFDRNTSPLTLTPAGEHFIREAQELLYQDILREHEETIARMQEPAKRRTKKKPEIFDQQITLNDLLGE